MIPQRCTIYEDFIDQICPHAEQICNVKKRLIGFK